MSQLPYCSRADVKDYASGLSAANTSVDVIIDQVIATATEQINIVCGRRFWLDDTVSPRLYGLRDLDRTQYGWGAARLFVHDIGDRTDVTIAVDTNGDGTYDLTWDTDSFFLEPLNAMHAGLENWPATAIVADTTLQLFPIFSSTYLRPQIQVTAKWGWPAIPSTIKSVALMTALDLLKMKDAPFGIAGFSEYGPIRARANAKVRELLDVAYCRGVAAIGVA